MPVKSVKFKKLRDAHHREKAEDYVEMIHDLLAEQGEARLTEIAQRFGVSTVTAHKIITRLQKQNLITTKPYRALFLTAKGKLLAAKSQRRHKIVYQFLRRLGVPERTAQIDAEGIEHHVSPETLKVFKKLLVLILLLFSPSTWAQDWENALVTDRPDAAESSRTVGKLRLQIETSFGFETDRGGGVTTNTYNFPTLFRFGLIDPLEFRVESPMGQFHKQTGQPHGKGWNDLAFGFKAHLLDQDGPIPSMGFLVHLSTPTGTNNYTANSYDPAAKWLNDWDLPAGFSLGTNIGLDVPQDAAGGRFARILYAAALGRNLSFISERLRIFAEIQGAVPVQSPQPNEQTFDSGLTFLLTPDIQLDTLVQVGLTDATTDVTTGLGFSWRVL